MMEVEQVDAWGREWEAVVQGSEGDRTKTRRFRVPGGWLVRHVIAPGTAFNEVALMQMCFVPEPSATAERLQGIGDILAGLLQELRQDGTMEEWAGRSPERQMPESIDAALAVWKKARGA